MALWMKCCYWLFLFQQVFNNAVIRLLEKIHTTTFFLLTYSYQLCNNSTQEKSQKESSMKIIHTEINCSIKNKLVHNFM